jgi:hypothetical protein
MDWAEGGDIEGKNNVNCAGFDDGRKSFVVVYTMLLRKSALPI